MVNEGLAEATVIVTVNVDDAPRFISETNIPVQRETLGVGECFHSVLAVDDDLDVCTLTEFTSSIFFIRMKLCLLIIIITIPLLF